MLTTYLTTAVLALGGIAGALPSSSKPQHAFSKRQNSTTSCTDEIKTRVPWTSLTEDEKTSYINADLCLINAPSDGTIPGAVTRWDDLQYPHVVQTVFVHNVGAFLPFHRYHMTAHERMIRDECGYTGPMPYWDELAEVESLDDISDSELWSYFGGNGVSSNDSCIADGPFANLTLRYQADGSTQEHCLTREFSQSQFEQAVQRNLDTCNAIETYEEAWECWSRSPHNAGHGGVGGIMVDATLSPGDPVFYLHHTYLDKLWWEWQNLAEERFWDMGGPNIPENREPGDEDYPGPEYTDYFGDGGGNVTTLNHNLHMAFLFPNVTIEDIMDIGGQVVCSDYQ